MILSFVFICTIQLGITSGSPFLSNNWLHDPPSAKCLTGYMTDVQSWVSVTGDLIVKNNNAHEVIDLSNTIDLNAALQYFIGTIEERSASGRPRFMSLARCGLSQVPRISTTTTSALLGTIEYITLYGNNFSEFQVEADQYDAHINATDITQVSNDVTLNKKRAYSWSAGFQDVILHSLKELDLRCNYISILDNFIFKGMPALEKLYLGENQIRYISANSFAGLSKLTHLDLSRNMADTDTVIGITFESIDTIEKLPNLSTLDFSFTSLTQRNINLLGRIGNKIQSLSLCYTGLNRLRDYMFTNTSITYLDLSGNVDILSSPKILGGTENTLRVLFAEFIALRTIEIVTNFSKLEILKLNDNEIVHVAENTVSTLKSLQVLDLTSNRITTWFTKTFAFMPKLKILSLKKNNINLISEDMLKDMKNIRYLGLAKNFMVCYCQMREMYNIALQNEFRFNASFIQPLHKATKDNDLSYIQNAYRLYNDMIRNRQNISSECFVGDKPSGDCYLESSMKLSGNFLFFDYGYRNYSCLGIDDSKTISISKVPFCNQSSRDLDTKQDIERGRNLLYLLCIPLIVLPILTFVYMFRRNFRYFFITMRNSAMLSLINTDDIEDESKLFNYDVFVSYCNEDRAWVLDHLLPHVEVDCSISVCLHERDFQVGLSILENIVSCMDRSKSIMLIISKRFLLSQWCQFEMHLAQHRLLETRREDLILILLEDIPRRLRPNTLHYLMLTKTYIVWPKEDSERDLFWRRMKKCLVNHKMKNIENDSLA